MTEEEIRKIARDEMSRHPFFQGPEAQKCEACGQLFYDLRHYNCPAPQERDGQA